MDRPIGNKPQRPAINQLYEGIDKELGRRDAEIAALRKALGLAWAWMDDPEFEITLVLESERMRDLKMEARHAKDVALALLTSGLV